MSVTEAAIRRAIYGKMAGDTTLNNLLGAPPANYAHSIYHETAPEGAGFPYVIFDKLDGRPTYVMKDNVEAMGTHIWLIKAVDRQTGADAAEAVAARLKDLMTDASLSIAGGTLLYLRVDGDVSYGEEANGETYKHSGYRFLLKYR